MDEGWTWRDDDVWTGTARQGGLGGGPAVWLHRRFDLDAALVVELCDRVVDQPLGGVGTAGDVKPEGDGGAILGGGARRLGQADAGDGGTGRGQLEHEATVHRAVGRIHGHTFDVWRTDDCSGPVASDGLAFEVAGVVVCGAPSLE